MPGSKVSRLGRLGPLRVDQGAQWPFSEAGYCNGVSGVFLECVFLELEVNLENNRG